MNNKVVSGIIWGIVCFCTAVASAIVAHYAIDWGSFSVVAFVGSVFGGFAVAIAANSMVQGAVMRDCHDCRFELRGERNHDYHNTNFSPRVSAHTEHVSCGGKSEVACVNFGTPTQVKEEGVWHICPVCAIAALRKPAELAEVARDTSAQQIEELIRKLVVLPESLRKLVVLPESLRKLVVLPESLRKLVVLQESLRKERIVSENLGKIADSQADKIVEMEAEIERLKSQPN